MEIIGGRVCIVAKALSRSSGLIDNVQGLLAELGTQLAVLKARIQETKQSIPGAPAWAKESI